MSEAPSETPWILTGSLENFSATRSRDFDVVGLKQRRRKLAEQIEIGDHIIFYVTKVQAFAGMVRVTGELFEDRSPIWPRDPAKPDEYPWRLETEPILVLPEDRFVPAELLAERLEHVRKWPMDHWQLAFQGQLRAVSHPDAAIIERAMSDAAHLLGTT